MDIDSFAQCLSFMQATSNVRLPVEKYLPVIGTLIGTGLGFGLNQYVTKRKENNSEKAKIASCFEECHELQHISSTMIEALAQAAGRLAIKERPIDHNFPINIDLILINKYYPEIAHRLSVDQRYWIRLVLRNVVDINDSLTAVLNSGDESSLYRISIWVINLIDTLIWNYKICDYILNDKQIEHLPNEEILFKFSDDKKLVECIRTLQDNIASKNSDLKLPNT